MSNILWVIIFPRLSNLSLFPNCRHSLFSVFIYWPTSGASKLCPAG